MTMDAAQGQANRAGAARERLAFRRLGFEVWRREIAPLWHMEGAVHLVAPLVNGYGQLQYCGREIHARVRHVPLAAELDGTRIAWTSIYNISDEALRLRGIYVLPEWRSNGIGRALVAHAVSLWPARFGHVFLYARIGNVGRYRRWGFEVVPGHVPRSHRTGIEGGQERIVQMMLRRGDGAIAGQPRSAAREASGPLPT